MNPATPEQRSARLRALLRQRAIRHGEFTLASGRKSSYYVDGRLVTLHHEGAWLVARVILDLLAREKVEAVALGGLTIGADPIAGAVAAVSHLEGRPLKAFIVRKEVKGHGTGKRVEGDLIAGDRVVVVDDVITTAGSTLQAIKAVEEIGCQVAAVVCLIDRQEGGAAALAGYRFLPMFTIAELLQDQPGPA